MQNPFIQFMVLFVLPGAFPVAYELAIRSPDQKVSRFLMYFAGYVSLVIATFEFIFLGARAPNNLIRDVCFGLSNFCCLALWCLTILAISHGTRRTIASIRERYPPAEWHLDGRRPHSIALAHGLWSGKTFIRIDNDETVLRKAKFTGLEHRFDIDGMPCLIRIENRRFHLTNELWVNGVLQSANHQLPS